MKLASRETIENITWLKTSFEPSYLRETQVYTQFLLCSFSTDHHPRVWYQGQSRKGKLKRFKQVQVPLVVRVCISLPGERKKKQPGIG